MNWLKNKDTCGAIMCTVDFNDLICKSSVPGPLLLSSFRMYCRSFYYFVSCGDPCHGTELVVMKLHHVGVGYGEFFF